MDMKNPATREPCGFAVQNVTRMTKEISREFQKVHYRMRIMRFQIIFTVLFIAGSGICFWQDMLGTAIALVSLAGIVNLTFGIMYLLIARRYNKAYDNACAPVFIYDFYESTMNAEFMHEGRTSSTSYSYKALFGVAVTSKIILLFVNNVRAFVLDKNGFSRGTCDEFLNRLRQQLPPNRIKDI